MEHPTKKVESTAPEIEQPGSPERKPYRAPELTPYGDLAAVTLGGGGKITDSVQGSLPV